MRRTVHREALQLAEGELVPLVPRAWACPLAREHARSFNESVSDLRAALLGPAAVLAGRGALRGELAACLARAVAELAFWRRVLVRVHGAAFEDEPERPDYLLWWVTGGDEGPGA